MHSALCEHALALLLLYIALLATAAVGQSSTAGFFGLLLVGYLLTFRVNPLPKKVEVSAIKEAECPTCGETIDFDNMWNCGCGFVKWEADMPSRYVRIARRCSHG